MIQRDYIPERLHTHKCRPFEIQVPSEISSSVFEDAQIVLDADADAQLFSDSTSAWVFPTTAFSVLLAQKGLVL